MLKIPTTLHTEPGTSTALDVIVELTEDGRPRLTIELGETELVHRIPDFVEPEFPTNDVAVDPELDPRILRLEEQNAELRQYRTALEEHVADLRRRLEAARERSIDRELESDEARAIAAALWHYAGEADAFGRRP